MVTQHLHRHKMATAATANDHTIHTPAIKSTSERIIPKKQKNTTPLPTPTPQSTLPSNLFKSPQSPQYPAVATLVLNHLLLSRSFAYSLFSCLVIYEYGILLALHLIQRQQMYQLRMAEPEIYQRADHINRHYPKVFSNQKYTLSNDISGGHWN